MPDPGTERDSGGVSARAAPSRTARILAIVLALLGLPLLGYGWEALREVEPVAPVAVDRPGAPRPPGAGNDGRRRSLRAGPVALRWQLEVPALSVVAPVWSVGQTSERVMDAPMGGPDDPVWDTVFWYRGGVTPGTRGTATIAGHVSGGRGASVFADLEHLRHGDRVVVRDVADRRVVRFEVTGRMSYPESSASDPRVLRRAFGAPAAEGRRARPGENRSARLVLITCAGRLVGSTYDRRLVVFASLVR